MKANPQKKMPRIKWGIQVLLVARGGIDRDMRMFHPLTFINDVLRLKTMAITVIFG